VSKRSARKSPTSRDARRTVIAAKRSTAGSEMSRAGYEDVKNCSRCGRRVLLAENARYHTDVGTGARTVTHIGCGTPRNGPG
jgi:hypothetical protein